MPYLPGKSGSWEPRKLPESHSDIISLPNQVQAEEPMTAHGGKAGQPAFPSVASPQSTGLGAGHHHVLR